MCMKLLVSKYFKLEINPAYVHTHKREKKERKKERKKRKED